MEYSCFHLNCHLDADKTDLIFSKVWHLRVQRAVKRKEDPAPLPRLLRRVELARDWDFASQTWDFISQRWALMFDLW
jgi:hypothetical protein